MAAPPGPTNIWPKYSSQLSGGWKCISFEAHHPSVQTSDPTPETLLAKPHGDSPLGRVLISSKGYLSAQILRPQILEEAQRKTPRSGGAFLSGDDAELARTARGLSMYCGYLELFEDDGDGDGKRRDGEAKEGNRLWWQTRVEVASDPSRVGGLEKRWVDYRQMDDGREIMTLRPFGEMLLEDGSRAKGVLQWEKFE